MLESQRDSFLLEEDVHYLNCAYMSPVSKRVEEAGIKGIRDKRNPHRVKAPDFFETSSRIRSRFGGLINASPERISIAGSVSYGIAVASRNISIETGDNIVVLKEQFPSNVYSWKRLAEEKGAVIRTVIPPAVSEQRGPLWNQRILEEIDARTAVVALPHVHWADGTLFDLKTIGERARDVDAAFIIDGTQSVGAYPFDVATIQPDALICACYKWLLGPYGIGLAYWGPRFENGIPIEENWINRLGSENFGGLVEYRDAYQPGAVRYDIGERSNFILLPMVEAALQHLDEWGIGNIQSYCSTLIQPFVADLDPDAYWVEDASSRSHHLFGVRVREASQLQRLTKAIDDAHISVSIRGNAVRISPNVYNSPRDLAVLAEAFHSFAGQI